MVLHHRAPAPVYPVHSFGHDDLTSSDLVGRFLIKGGATIWVDGSLPRAVRAGGICYLDESRR
jgi:MoxR-like ATPase